MNESRRWRKVIGCVVYAVGLLALAGSSMAAEPGSWEHSLTNQFEHLQALVASTQPEDPNYNNRRETLLRALIQAQREYETGDFRNAQQQLDSARTYAQTDAFRQEFKKLQTAFDQAVKARIEEAVATGEAASQSASELCATAGDEAKIEALLKRVTDAQQVLNPIANDGYAGSRMQTLRDKLTNLQGLLTAWREVVRQQRGGNLGAAMEQLNRLSQNSSYGLLVPSDCIQKLKTNLTAAFQASIDSKLKGLEERLSQAESPAAVEAVIQDITAVSAEFGRSGMDMAVRNRVERFSQAARAWMTVVSAEQAGDTRGALAALAALDRGQLGETAALPVEMLSKRKAALFAKIMSEGATTDPALIAVVDESMQKVKSATDLTTVAARLNALMGAYSGAANSPELAALAADLAAFGPTATRDWSIQSWTARTGRTELAGRHRWQPVIQKYREQVLLDSLKSRPGLEKLALERDGQTVSAVLLSHADDAAKKGEWMRVIDLLQAHQEVVAGGVAQPLIVDSELSACRQYITGQRLEAAGQIVEAMVRYRAVLESTGRRIPLDETTARLKALDKQAREILARQEREAGSRSAVAVP